MARVLVVDDEAGIRTMLTILLREDQHEICEADGVIAATRVLSERPFDVVIADQLMKDGQGLQVLAAAKEADSNLPVILVTAHASIELAVESMKQGAFDFLAKPFTRSAVLAAVARAAEHAELRRENERLRELVRRSELSDDLLGQSRGILMVRDQIARVAPTNATVLITGETGTGKELVARAVHRGSPRKDRPFIAVNCAGLPETLLESELFGHERGAFTGADRSRAGLFESADQGTLFLDEAGEMSLPLQAKLLRVLTDGMVQRIGSRSGRKVDVRLLVATHRDLKKLVTEQQFRQDLYYRIAVFPIEIPPVRERLDDLPLLVEHFVVSAASEMNLPPKRLTPAAMSRLAAYRFPGNVRELRNLIERALLLSTEEELLPRDLPLDGAEVASAGTVPFTDSIDLRSYLEETERQLILHALKNANHVQAEAARRLGLSRSDLAYKVRKHNIRIELEQD
jgi:DNA-binding NtrC family response regulator